MSYAQTEIASYGYLDDARLLYHLAYQPSKEQTDIYLLSPLTRSLTVQAGEIGLLGQYIPKLDVFASRPLYLQPLGFGENGPFAPGANAFAVRVVGSLDGTSAMPYADGWKFAATVPFSNEASSAWQPGFDGDPTGLFAEVFRRTGMNSYGLNTFTGRDGRRYYGAVGQLWTQNVYFEGGAAYASAEGPRARLASLGATFVPEYHQAYGFRIDSQNGAFIYTPTLSYMIGDQFQIVRLTAEARISRGAPTAVFSAQWKF